MIRRSRCAWSASASIVALALLGADAPPADAPKAPAAIAVAQRALLVPRDGAIVPLPERLDPALEDMRFEFAGSRSTLLEALRADSTDGFLVLHDGAIVYERYFGDFGPRDHHIWASCTKSLVGLAFGSLAAEGRIDAQRRVTELLPELRGSGFERLALRQLLDMTAALDFDEDYAVRDAQAPAYRYFSRLGLVSALAPGDTAPRGIRGFLPVLRANPRLQPGNVFEYQSPDADVIGWIVSRVSGMPLEKFVAERIWGRIGAEHDAFFSADADLVPIATGGFNTTLRDAARLGLALLQNGRVAGREVLPESWLADALAVTPADRAAVSRSIFRTPGHAAFDAELEAYRGFWWILDAARGEFMARGVYGQYVYVNRAAHVVIASFASASPPSNARRETFKRKLRATRALAAQLAKETP